MKYPKLLRSSVNPNKLSLMVEGLLLALIPIIIVIAQAYNFPLSEVELVDMVKVFMTFAAGAISLYGLVRKIVMKFKKKNA